MPVEREELRKTEFEAFKFSPGGAFSAPSLGGSFYDTDSLEPVFLAVDPEAAAGISKGTLAGNLGTTSSLFGAGVLVVGIVSADGEGIPASAFTSGVLLFGIGAGLGIYSLVELSDSAGQYNDKLWKRTAPAAVAP